MYTNIKVLKKKIEIKIDDNCCVYSSSPNKKHTHLTMCPLLIKTNASSILKPSSQTKSFTIFKWATYSKFLSKQVFEIYTFQFNCFFQTHLVSKLTL